MIHLEGEFAVKNEDFKEIGNRIRMIRKMKKVTQKELATAINRTESSVAKYEQGRVEIPRSVLIGIANFLDADTADLLGIRVRDTPPSVFSASFNWLRSLGYKLVVYEEEEYRVVLLRDERQHKDYPISEVQHEKLVNDMAAYSKFLIHEAIKNTQEED